MSLEALLQSLGVQQPQTPLPPQRPPMTQDPRYQSMRDRYIASQQPSAPGQWRPPTGGVGGGTPSPTTPPPGFSSQQWAQVLNLSKMNPAIANLVKQVQGGIGGMPGRPGKPGTPTTPKPPADPWRREMPTDTSQLLRQLSFNAGEMGMPGGYVGAVQIPAYGSTQAPVNNPDMTTYGQQPGIGEATYYMQSMNGGMAPIAAMSPLGVPAGWNPGGAGGGLSYYQKRLMQNGGLAGLLDPGFQPKSFQETFEDMSDSMTQMGSGVGPDQISLFNAAFAPESQSSSNKSSSSKSVSKNKSGTGNGGKKPGNGSSGGSAYKPANKGVPISLPYGY